MKTFPMFLRLEGRTVVIVGGGEQAAQKCRLMLKTEARIVVAWPTLDPELAGLAQEGRIDWHQDPITIDAFCDAALVFVATGCPGSATALHALAEEAGALVNVVDQPALCSAVTPSIVDRDPVVVAIGTEGTAPVLARRIKSQMETLLEPRLGELAALAGRLRPAVAATVPPAKRRGFWAWVFSGAPRDLFRTGAERAAARSIKSAIADGGAPKQTDEGRIALVGAGPGAADLLTLRAVQALQEADVIFYDRLVGPEILELARRDAERVYVGKEVGGQVWPQSRISALIVSAARRGQRVVRLKSGDPLLFARAGEELAAAAEAGIPVDIVPGVTAAAAAAASLGKPLTERGETDRAVLATGTCRPSDAPPDMAEILRPGTSVALYMSVSAAPCIQRDLLAQGYPRDIEADVVANASRADEVILRSSLGRLAQDMAAADIDHPAILFLRAPKSRYQALPEAAPATRTAA
ncbi:MAG: siroheme synthase CysG [Pseudomonadota bacterium]